MTSGRLLSTLAAVLLALAGVAAPTLADDSGGAAVQLIEGEGGGVVAFGGPSQEPAPEAETMAPPVEAAQEDTPTTPGGEEQPPDEEPGEEEPGDGMGPVDDLPEDGAAPEAGEGFLPSTGFELVALTAIGLGLLLAGGALWPTSSWPQPRARLSRSTLRR